MTSKETNKLTNKAGNVHISISADTDILLRRVSYGNKFIISYVTDPDKRDSILAEKNFQYSTKRELKSIYHVLGV